MSEDLERYYPERVIDRVLRTDASANPWRSRAVLFFSWVVYISGTVSFVSGLWWVRDVAQLIYDNAGYLFPIVAFFAEIAHAIVSGWRFVTEPIHQLLFGWLPVRVPREVLDLLAIASVVAGGYVRAWFATREERQFLRIIQPPEGAEVLSLEGRIAVVKRLIAAQDVFRGPFTEAQKDRAEQEFTQALEEMTGGVSERDFDVFEHAMFNFTTPSDFEEFLYRCAMAEETVRDERGKIERRTILIASALLVLLAIDLAYRLLS